ncbi:MAG: magnesium transporter [Candidatus Bathyarchaeota archaeon]|nr:magnesium transporter [Candidatus Bathyarchaeota archaeon]
MWKGLHNNVPHLRGRIEPHLRGVTRSTSAQAFNLVGIIAGSILAGSYENISQIPWALLIFPGLLIVRGSIGGLFSGRLSTALHLGTIKPVVSENTKDAYLLYAAIITLTWISSALLGTAACFTSFFTVHLGLKEAMKILLVTFTSLGLSILVISPTTFLVSIHSFNRGLDPDMVVYPITSSTADVAISFVYVFLLTLIKSGSNAVYAVMLFTTVVFTGCTAWLYFRYRGEREYVKTIKEFMGTLLVVTLIVNITGVMLGRISERIGDMAEIYAIYPAIIDTVGDVGSMTGSTATTKLSLGVLKADISSLKSHLSEISYAWSGSLIMFTLYAFISASMFGFTNFRALLATVWWTNLLVIPVISVVSFAVGIVTFQRGLDPDNFVIPFETSLADGLTTVFLYLMIIVWY